MDYLKKFDEVRNFPNLQMPAPSVCKTEHYIRIKKRSKKNLFPGLMTTASIPLARSTHEQILDCRRGASQQGSYSFTNLKLDGSRHNTDSNDLSVSKHRPINQISSELSFINFGTPSISRDEYYCLKKETMNQSNNLIVSKEEYRQSQFMIYRGVTLSSTPEFRTFHSTYSHIWTGITGVIRVLESYLRAENIKLAVIDGTQVMRVALNGSTIDGYKQNILSCILSTNGTDRLSPSSASSSTRSRSVITIQVAIRKFLLGKRLQSRAVRNMHTISIQKCARRLSALKAVRFRIALAKSDSDTRWTANLEKLKSWWKNTFLVEVPFFSSSSTHITTNFIEDSDRNISYSMGFTKIVSQGTTASIRSSLPTIRGSQTRLLVFIPSICSPEYIRLSTDRFHALQNMHIACLYQLVDPHVHVLYISPIHLSEEEIGYNESLLLALGIPSSVAGVKRLHYIVPDMIDKLPPHISLSHVLLCSTVALKKIKSFIRLIPNAMIVPSTISWTEKKLSNYLDIPLLSPDPTVATTIMSKSFSMGIFKEACVNISQGTRDIFSTTDFYVSLSSLIISNLEVNRWIFRLNSDINHEGYAYLDVEKLSVISSLRGEVASMIANGDSSAFYDKNVQLEYRKKVLHHLRAELSTIVIICRQDLQGGNWDKFEKRFQLCGLVIDAEQSDIVGFVQGLCFIDPCGAIHVTQGVDQLIDSNYQIQGYLGPQTSAPHTALNGATAAVAKVLFEKWNVIGYVAVEFVSHWDSEENASRLVASGLKFGLGSEFLGVGTASLAGSCVGSVNLDSNRGFLPSLENPNNNFFVYLPHVHHTTLSLCRDEIFLKICKMKGISFDMKKRKGTLFFHVDKLLGECISTICIESTKQKSLINAINTLNFIIDSFGKDSRNFSSSSLSSILYNLQTILKKEIKMGKKNGYKNLYLK